MASVVALVAVPAAYAAYTSAKFEVTQAETTTTIKLTVDPNDDPTAILQIILPTGTQVTTNQAPGTALGRARAVMKALDLGGADLALEGEVLVAAPGQVSAAVRTACIADTPVAATWVLELSAAEHWRRRSSGPRDASALATSAGSSPRSWPTSVISRAPCRCCSTR
jgi:hypothetical protein